MVGSGGDTRGAVWARGVVLAAVLLVVRTSRRAVRSEDLTLDGGRVESGVDLGEDVLGRAFDPVVSLRPVLWCLGKVVFLDHFRAVAGLGDQFLLWEK